MPDAAVKPLCFVIAPIGDAESETRKKSDQVLKHIIKKALEPNYVVKRADDISRPGIITVQIIQRLLDAPLVVADLTDQNANVFYELAIRHAAKKPTIHIIAAEQDIPFDVQDMRVVPYNLSNPDSIDAARAELLKYETAFAEGEQVITPVQLTQILSSVAADQNRDKSLYALIEALNTGISNLQASIGEIANDSRSRRFAEAFGLQRAVPLSALAAPATGFHVAPPTADHKESVFARARERIEKAKEEKK